MIHQNRLVLFFIRWLIEPYSFGSGIFDMALDMIGRLIYQIKQVFLCRGPRFHTRDSQV